jgi:hypothetical protein
MVGKDKCPYARSGQAAQCRIPDHWSKPNLFKTGAERICGMLGVTVHFPTLDDYEQAALDGLSLRQIILRCELKDSYGRTVAEGMGARSLQQDYGDLNKSLKMAGKSALIDATLRLAGLSEVFTQDVEDASGEVGAATAVSTPPAPSTPPASPANESETLAHGPPSLTATQLDHLELRIKTLRLDRNRVLSWLEKATKGQVKGFEQLTASLYDPLVARLETFADQGDIVKVERRMGMESIAPT